MRIFEIPSGRLRTTLTIATGSVPYMEFDATGRHVLTNAMDGGLRATNIESGASTTLTAAPGELYRHFEASRDGRFVASATGSQIVLWDARTWREARRIETAVTVAYVTMTRDGRYVASSGHDGAVRLWETATGRMAGTLCGSGLPHARLKFSSDGRRLLVVGADGQVRVFGAKPAGR